MRKGLIFMLLSFVLFACTKNENDEQSGKDESVINEKVEQAYQEIKVSADSVLLSEDPNFYALAQECENREEVKRVDATDESLMIEFTNGVIRGWLKTQNDNDNPDYQIQQMHSSIQKSIKLNRQNITLETKAKICIVNAIYNNEEPFFYQIRDSVTNIANSFTSKEWDIDIKNGIEASVMFYKNEMNNYDVIYNITHGMLGLGNTWIITGDSIHDSSLAGFVAANKQIAIVTLDEVHNGETVTVAYMALSGQFFSDNYTNKKFPNSFIYLVACHGLEYPEQFAKIFVDNGAKVVVGWDNTNCLGVYTGNVLLTNMLNNNTNLANTINQLSINKIYDTDHNANLTVYPVGIGGNYVLPSANPWGTGFSEVSSYSFSDGEVTLLKKTDQNNTRVNADGTKYYKTTIAVGLEKNGTTFKNIIETEDVYASADMNPCMLIDLEKEIITVFANSKTPDKDYGMNGYAYKIDKNSDTWQKETVYSKANHGWYPFFGGSNVGNPELCHFSYAGYYAMLSSRNTSGNWTTQNTGSIKPDLANRQYYSHKNILVTSSSNVDRMSFQDSSSYDNLIGFTNNPSTSLISGYSIICKLLKGGC